MAKPIPFTGARALALIVIFLLLLSFPIYAQIIYISPSGSNTTGDGTAGSPYQTISYGVSVATAGNTLQLQPGTYNEMVTINKSLIIDGMNATQVTVTYTGTISDYSTTGTILPTLFKVTAQNVVIRNIKFTVNQNIVHSAIHTSGDASGLQVLNNNIIASVTAVIPFCCTTSATALAYARRNAIAINPNIGLPATKYTRYGAGLTNIKISGNYITGTTAAQNGVVEANFRAAIHADNVMGLLVGGTVAEKNTLQTINHDVIVRFLMDGNTIIRNNEFNGGGIEVSSSGATTGVILIDSNNFNYLPPTAPNFPLLRMWNGNTGHPATIYGNTFYNSNWYIGLGNFNTVTVDSNSFTPVIREPATRNYYRHITVNTKVLQTSATTQVINNAVIIQNQFYAAASADGKGIAFYNHDAIGSNLSTYAIGATNKENTFHAGITRFLYVDNSNGQTTTSMTSAYPEYGSGIFNTSTARWTRDMDASQNFYNVGTGSAIKPDFMDTATRVILNSMIFDNRDDNAIGLIHLYNVILPLRERAGMPVRNEPVYGYACYPNPVVQAVNVKVTASKKQLLQIRLYSLSGHCLQTKQSNTNTLSILPMQQWPAGMYIVEMTTGGKIWTHQVIKTK